MCHLINLTCLFSKLNLACLSENFTRDENGGTHRAAHCLTVRLRTFLGTNN